MPDFSRRSREHEILDGTELVKEELFQNLREIDFINKTLGGHSCSLKGIMQIIKAYPNKKHWVIADLGCGGGDTLIEIKRFLQSQNLSYELYGIDNQEHIVEFANNKLRSHPDITVIHSSFENTLQYIKPDICHAALFAHHLYDDTLLSLVKTLQSSKYGYVLNDLHRHPIAYHSIKHLTKWLAKSSYVKHDACLSVAKGFSQTELKELFQSDYHHTQVKWVWAFRYLVCGIRKLG